MASRQSRKSTTTTASTSGETPTRTGVSPGRRARSPSPARITRMQEKEQLQNLNDRLAAYLDRVKYLEGENSRLSTSIRTYEETKEREVSSCRELFENEIAELRNLLDATSKEKAGLKLEATKYKTEAEDWRAKYTRRDRDAKAAEKKNLEYQSEIGDLNAKLNDAENKRKYADGEVARLRAELNALEHQLAETRKQLEDETIARVDLENRIQSLKEELAFKDTMHEREINETRTRFSTTIDEFDAGAQVDYDTKLSDAVQQIRQEHDESIRQVREELEDMYDRKLQEMKDARDRSISEENVYREEYMRKQLNLDKLKSENANLRAQVNSLEARIADLEQQLRSEQELFETRLRQKDTEILELRDELDAQMQEYVELLDIKLKLDAEIDTYRKLLEGGEERLNISATSTDSSTPKKGRGTKRKRVTLDVSAVPMASSYGFDAQTSTKGAIEIHDTDHDGKFIKLFNTGEEDVSLGGYVLKHTAGDQETAYKFHRNSKLAAGHFVTVWSANSGQTHSPPTDIVMKDNKQWHVADEMKSVLYHDDEEVASRTMKKSERRAYRSLRDVDEVDGRDKCSIM